MTFNEATPFQAWRQEEPPRCVDCGEVPSTKPRPFRRGDRNGGHPSNGQHRPSTKPRPFRRGDVGHHLRLINEQQPPSTKPRPFRRGDCQRASMPLPSMWAFNEATPFQAWRPQVLAELERLLDPSTKPRPFRRGDRRSLRSAGYWGLFREPPARDPQDLESRAGHAFRAEVLFGGESGFSAPFERLRDEVSPPHRSQASTT